MGRSKLIMNETFLKSIPRETPYSESSCLRGFFATSESACVASSTSSSDDGSVPLFDSSVARIMSYTPLLNSSTMCNLKLDYQLVRILPRIQWQSGIKDRASYPKLFQE